MLYRSRHECGPNQLGGLRKCWARASIWREQLVATTCVLATENRTFHNEIMEALSNYSFVYPQLLVAFSLLHHERADDLILSYRDKEWTSDEFKLYGAVEVVCKHCNIIFSQPSEYRNALESDEYNIGKRTAEEHLKFWSDRINGHCNDA